MCLENLLKGLEEDFNIAEVEEVEILELTFEEIEELASLD